MQNLHGRQRGSPEGERCGREELLLGMHARFLEQRPAPALARHLVTAHLGDVRGERQVEPRSNVREHLVAAV